MDYIPDNFVGIVAIIFSLGLPVIAVVMAFWSSMHKKSKDKEIRQLIIENHTDAETAKLLIDEPKKQPRKMGPFNLENLRAACILLGIGLGACIDWLADVSICSSVRQTQQFCCARRFALGRRHRKSCYEA